MACLLDTASNLTLCCWDRFFADAPVDPDAIVSDLKTGDLYLARANRGGRSAAQIVMGSSPWDHSGIIWVHKGVAYVIDSGSSRYYPDLCVRPFDFDHEHGSSQWSKLSSGPQMYPLLEFIKRQGEEPLNTASPPRWYYERIGIRKLRKPLTEEQHHRMERTIREMSDRPYEKTGETTAAAIDICDCCCASMVNTEEHRESLFCSELVAAIYIDTGLLPRSPTANEYVPADFSVDRGSNLSSLCCCCCFSWMLRRACSIGDLRDYSAGGKLLFEPCNTIISPVPPQTTLVKQSQPVQIAQAEHALSNK